MPTDHPRPLPMIEEADATGELADIYAAIKRDTQSPFVPNMSKAVGVSVSGLRIHTDFFNSFLGNISLPKALMSIIFFTVAEQSDCEYCASAHEITCRTLGVDDATLALLGGDLAKVNPERVRAIVEFALKVAKYPQSITDEDYKALRDHGITDSEIVEIVLTAGYAVYLDIVADALKIPVDEQMKDALPHRQEQR